MFDLDVMVFTCGADPSFSSKMLKLCKTFYLIRMYAGHIRTAIE